MTANAQPAPKPVRQTPIRTYLRDYIVDILGQVRILKKVYPGIMHFLIFWGMTLLVIGHVVLLMQMALFLPFALPFPRGNTYLLFETISDFAGLALLFGVGMALVRRLALKPSYLESRWDDFYALLMLALIPLLGYLNGALRIIGTEPEWAAASPIENLVAQGFLFLGMTVETANRLHFPMVLVHLTFGLLFIASIPYTKLRHLVATPLNILLRKRGPDGEIETIADIENTDLLGAGAIQEFEPHQLLSFDACLRCGRCEEACPATLAGMPYSPRLLIQTLRDHMQTSMVTPLKAGSLNGNTPDIFGEDYNWACTTCGACIVKCPAFVNPVDQVLQLRRYQVLTSGKMPKTVGETLRNMERQGNPWGLPPQERGKWYDGLDLPLADPDRKTDVLLFFGCAMAFDERNKKIARRTVEMLDHLGIEYAALGMDESCCGETARRMGHEYVFQVMAEQNIEIFNELQFDRIVTPCPHCLNTFKNEYPAFGGEYLVQHISELLEEKLPNSRQATTSSEKVTYHDPCYLGRYNQVFDPPRNLAAGSGSTLVEMSASRQNSLCCGGGGGQMWLETDAETRINHLRLDQAVATGADTIITSCPYCLTMFEDALGAKGLQDTLKIRDLTEVLEIEKV
jgi:Fe-S oxidoreductase/nitrate reductase gamma subunit